MYNRKRALTTVFLLEQFDTTILKDAVDRIERLENGLSNIKTMMESPDMEYESVISAIEDLLNP